MTDTEDRIEEEHVNEVLKSRVRRLWFLTVVFPIALILIVIALTFIPFGSMPKANINIPEIKMSSTQELWSFISKESFTTPALIILGGAIILSLIYEKGKKTKIIRDNNVKATTSSIKLDPFSPAMGEMIRWLVFIIFHTLVGGSVWLFLDTYIYAPLGRSGFLFNVVETASYLVLTASIWSSFDVNSIELNFKGELLWFGKPVFSNIPHGFFCLGLPRWIGPEIRLVNTKLNQITFGLMKDGKREDFVLEGKGFFVIFDMAFSVKAADTRIVLSLEDDPEKMLVTRMNEVVNRFVNMPCFPTIDSLKVATTILSHKILTEPADPDSANRGETACELFKQIGFELVSVDIKDVQNADKTLITAKQALEARKLSEEEEKLSVQNMHDKTKELYDSMIKAAGLTNLSEAERLKLWRQCREDIERDEGKRKTYEGLGRTFASIDTKDK